MIPQSFTADLLNRIDIVDVVGQYVSLKKAGGNFQGLCPFHNEKSASFSVSPTKQFYHCFGCGAHGSAIGFLMEYSGLSYVEAIEDLARSAGLNVPREERTPGQVSAFEQSMALTEVMEKAAHYYVQQLKQSDRAIDYLKRRGLSGEIAKQFGLGYAPDAWTSLSNVFGPYSQDKTAKLLAEVGLLIQGEDDGKGTARRYDRFRDRVMFPIKNTKGQVIAFGGRILDKGEPKYLNSPETTIFKKGQTLYGLFEGRKAIREKGYALVCEGYMDVVALAQLGFGNAVATLGTACTSYHVQALMRQTDKIVFSFDGDAAGQRAAKRALEACLPMLADDKEIRFLFLPTEHDPDSYVREKGVDAFSEAIKVSLPLSAFLIKTVGEGHDWETAEGRAQAQSAAKPYLKSMPAIALRSQIIRELAIKTGLQQSELEKFYGFEVLKQVPVESSKLHQTNTERQVSYTDKNTGKPKGTWKSKEGVRAEQISKQKPIAPTDLAEQLMRIFLQFPMLAKNLLNEDKEFAIVTAKRRSVKAEEVMTDLLHRAESLATGTGFAAFQAILDESDYAKAYGVLSDRVLQAEMTEEDAQKNLRGALDKIKIDEIKREMTEIADRIAKGNAGSDDLARYRKLGLKLR